MSNEKNKETFLKDYKAPEYQVDDFSLIFELDDTKTKVETVRQMSRVSGASYDAPLVLNGVNIKLLSIRVDGKDVAKSNYTEEGDLLTITSLPEKFTLEIDNEINPKDNKSLEGLYMSGDMYCTQNEAEGFRKITYYQDRPDVMTKFTTKIIADKKGYPVLLSNGNLIDSGDLEGGKHFAVWEDPFKKPAYLYALVAGDLGHIKDEFTTRSGKMIPLLVYCDKGAEEKCWHAMESLKKSMVWDEERFDREYDLDMFMIVAVDSFNAGAMENKGLNIFNSVYVLANQETATDNDFLGIEAVVAHEYFHNWTGNRITCRDWFQLTLKEGLTVFRDEEFSSDLHSRVVERINKVKGLRAGQFAEDGGPTSHPIKPASYIKMDNFYTATVYEKGAEVIRMIYTLLGRDGFKKGMDKYFELFDGQAVRTEDFIHSMSVANNNFDFTQFENWYHQAGTPVLDVNYSYDEKAKTFELKVLQNCPDTPGQTNKKPFHLPLEVGLLGKNGKDIKLILKDDGGYQPHMERGILNIRNREETFIFENVGERPIVSLNRGFSAPVRINAPYTKDDLLFLSANDSDDFNRSESMSKLSSIIIGDLLSDFKNNKELVLHEGYINAFGKLLEDKSIDNSFKAMTMAIPPLSELIQDQAPIDFRATHEVREFIKRTLAITFKDSLLETYNNCNKQSDFKLDDKSMGERSLKSVALAYLMATGEKEMLSLCYEQFKNATNMSDEISSLAYLADCDCPEREEALKSFYNKWKHETLVMQKWMAVQAMSTLPNTIEEVKKLAKDSVYDITVPNHVRALYRTFANNHLIFNNPDGSGYKLVADLILELDIINPSIAANISGTFKKYKLLMPENKKMMKEQLDRILAKEGLSSNTQEIVDKIIS